MANNSESKTKANDEKTGRQSTMRPSSNVSKNAKDTGGVVAYTKGSRLNEAAVRSAARRILSGQ